MVISKQKIKKAQKVVEKKDKQRKNNIHVIWDPEQEKKNNGTDLIFKIIIQGNFQK